MAGHPTSILDLPPRKLWNLFYSQVMSAVPPESREEIRKQLTKPDPIYAGSAEAAAAGISEEVQQLAAELDRPIPDWWDDDHDPFADQW